MATAIVNDMSTRNRRICDERRAAARQRNGERNDISALGAGETRLVRFAYTLSCSSCGYSDADEMIATSSAPAGAHVDITTSCTCGGETHGMARVLEIVEEVLT